MIFLDTETFFDSKNKYSLRSKGMTQESYVRDPRFELISISVAVDDGEPRCFYRDDPRWDDFIRWLRGAVKAHPVVSHNAPFDMSILAWRLDVHPIFMADTLAMARPMHLKCSAEELAKHYGLTAKLDTLSKHMNGRHLADMSPELRIEFAEYNNQDVRLCRHFWHLLKPHYTLKELKLVHLTLDMYLYPRVQIDTTVLNAQLNKILSDRATILSNLGVELGDLRSAETFANLLRGLGVEPPMKISPTTGQQAFAFAKKDPALLELQNHPSPRVVALVEAKIGCQSSIRQTRAERFLGIAERSIVADGLPWLPIPLRYYGAHSGRFSGDGKINLQNLQNGVEGTRAAIVPPLGCKLISVDLSAIEARMLAWLAGAERALEVFKHVNADGSADEEHGDIYAQVASDTYGVIITKRTHKRERNVGKVQVLGLGFYQGWRKFAAELFKGFMGMPPMLFTWDDAARLQVDVAAFSANQYKQQQLQEYLATTGFVYTTSPENVQVHCAVSDALVTRWRENNPEITAKDYGYWAKCDLMLRYMVNGIEAEFGPIRTAKNRIIFPNGLGLYYHNLRKDKTGYSYESVDGWRGVYSGKVCENITQGLARIVMTDAMLEVDKHLRDEIKIAFTVHDELIATARAERALDMKREMIKIMTTSRDWYKTLPLAAEGSVVDHYGEAK